MAQPTVIRKQTSSSSPSARNAKGSDDVADDIICGAAAIAKFLFGDPKQRNKIYYLAGPLNPNEKLPVFRLGATLCARRSTLVAWIAEREGRSRQ